MSVATPHRRQDLALTLRRRLGPSILVTAGILIVLAIVDVSLQPALANLDQIGLLLQTALPLVLVSVAQTLVVLVGGIDLSVGGMFVVANAITVVWVGAAGGAHQALLVVALAAGLAMGAINGLLVVGLRFEPFIATLGHLDDLQRDRAHHPAHRRRHPAADALRAHQRDGGGDSQLDRHPGRHLRDLARAAGDALRRAPICRRRRRGARAAQRHAGAPHQTGGLRAGRAVCGDRRDLLRRRHRQRDAHRRRRLHPHHAWPRWSSAVPACAAARAGWG